MNDWWSQLKPQVVEMIRDLNFSGIYADDLQDILRGDNWLTDEYIQSYEFNFEAARFTLEGLCDMFQLFTGDYYFRHPLKWKIEELLNQSEFQRPVVEEYREDEVA